jgi:hypothetical protein
MVEAQALTEMTDRWAPYNMNVYGPVGLDLAVSKDACHHKKYTAVGGGEADILLVPTYEVGNGLGTAKVHLAVEEGAHGELARVGLARAKIKQGQEDLLGDVGRCVATYLNDILACVGIWRAHNGNKHLVKDFPAVGADVAKHHGMRLALGKLHALAWCEDV